MFIKVVAQYFENYNTSGEGEPYWKPKFGGDFVIEIDQSMYDEVMWATNDMVVKALQILLDEQSNSMARYEYRDHEVVRFEPEPLEGFSNAFQRSKEELGLV